MSKIESYEKIIKVIDITYVFFYIIIGIIASLLVVGYQDVVLAFVPHWADNYILANVIILVFSVINIFLILSNRKKLEFFILPLFALFFGVWMVIVVSILFIFPVEGGVIFRSSFTIWITIFMIIRWIIIYILLRGGLK